MWCRLLDAVRIGAVACSEFGGEVDVAPIGPVRYSLVIFAKDEEGEETGETVSVVVNGLALPRTGDRLYFDGGTTTLSPTVVEVAHWFTPPEDGIRCRELVVRAEVDSLEDPMVRRLLDSVERERWIARFPMLETDHLNC
jgi:hypothetical protein